MINTDIMDGVTQGIENMLFKNWRHEGYIDGMHSTDVIFVVDGKKYILKLEEM
jgi:hypothetical protein